MMTNTTKEIQEPSEDEGFPVLNVRHPLFSKCLMGLNKFGKFAISADSEVLVGELMAHLVKTNNDCPLAIRVVKEYDEYLDVYIKQKPKKSILKQLRIAQTWLQEFMLVQRIKNGCDAIPTPNGLTLHCPYQVECKKIKR